jgi:hypothetical protein
MSHGLIKLLMHTELVVLTVLNLLSANTVLVSVETLTELSITLSSFRVTNGYLKQNKFARAKIHTKTQYD